MIKNCWPFLVDRDGSRAAGFFRSRLHRAVNCWRFLGSSEATIVGSLQIGWWLYDSDWQWIINDNQWVMVIMCYHYAQ